MKTTYLISADSITGLGFDLASSTIAMSSKLDNFKETQFHDDTHEPIIGSSIQSSYIDETYPTLGIAKLKFLLKKTILQSLNKLGLIEKSETNVPFYKKWAVVFVLSDDHSNLLEQLISLVQEIPYLSDALYAKVCIGSAGTGIAIQMANTILEEDKADAVIVCSMDTWLQPSTINKGLRKNRLLTSDKEDGCIPSEAVSAVILSHQPHEAFCSVYISGLGIGEEPIPFSNTDKPTMGRGLRDAYRTALSMSAIEMTDVHLRLGDVTGEEYFFQESITGYSSVLEGVMPKGYEALIISSYLGDIRSVSGIFGMAYVWQLAQKGQFNEKFALVHMSSPSHTKRTVVALKAEASKNLPLPVSETILPAVVEQHISDASMYWLRQQDAIWHPIMKYQDILRFKKLMHDHLEGIITSGIGGFKLALKQLKQWKTSDEIFVSLYAYLNLNTQKSSDIEMIEDLTSKDMSLNIAAASALMHAENDFTREFALDWWYNGTPTQKSASLFFVLKQSEDDKKIIKEALLSSFAPIRRQIIKYIGDNRYIEFESEIHNALKDDDELCKIEAACSLALFDNSKSMSLFNGKELITIPLPMRNFMIWSYTVKDTVFEQWLDYAQETDNIWPLLWSIFFRSENQYINEVLNILQSDKYHKYSRLTAFVVKHLVGIDIEKLEIFIKAENIEEDPSEDVLVNSVLPKYHWNHPYQVDILQAGMLYPDIIKLKEKIDLLAIQLDNKKVIDGVTIDDYEDIKIRNKSLPQLAIYSLDKTIKDEYCTVKDLLN